MENKPNKIIWHHSADAQKEHQFRKIDNYHRERGFPKSALGFYIGYHWIIEKDGLPVQARLETEIGAHDAGENVNSLGVCLAGNFSTESPTPEQEKTAYKLVKEIMARWQIPITRIEPHRWGDTTECPGRLLDDRWLAWNYIKHELSLLKKLLEALKLKLGQF